ncbi:WD40 repeat domain-containing protein [bacterium]|nr:WD40 repeat domain-containing protein [bacterium]
MLDNPHVFKAHTSHITSLTFTPDSLKLISAGMDNLVHLWSVPDWKKVQTLEGHEKSVNSVSLLPKGNQLLTASSDRTARLWDLATGEQLQQFDQPAHTAHLSPDGRWMIDVDNPWLTVVNFDSGESLKRFKPFSKRTTAVAFSPDSTHLILGGQGDDLLIYNMPEMTLQKALQDAHERFVLSARFSPQGNLLATTGYEQRLKIWSPKDWTVLHEIPLENQGVQSLAFSPDGRTLAVASDHRVTLVDPDSGVVDQKVNLPPKGVYCLAFSPDGNWLACGAADKRIRVWALNA